ncbi:hypothetical protein [Endozoicomonas sp. 8E]|uniref:hypothetical protein n=1 Tax=Endozoicomonas sp. 8E TaxID=3035692 RepID=UPI002938DAFB|nr:hypothetical protein [Endozoicomonas sp. 8E]WOG27011.1 hypothetical protein P6910_21035 [Endozoicomonas sp. 8E]
MPLLLLSVITQAEPLTRRFIVELQQDPDSPNQSFFINSDPLILSGKPSVITNTNSYSGSDFPLYDTRQRLDSNRVKRTLIESISWQWLYATNLLVTYELTLTTRGTPLSPTPYSWLLIETAVAVGRLLQSYWNPDSLLFKPIGIHMLSTLALEDHRFVITTMVPGSEQQQQQQGQLSESSGKQAPQASSHPAGAFTSPRYSSSTDGNGDSQQQSHTLGLNCFVHPCHGVCKFRSLSDHTYSTSAWTPYAEPICPPVDKATIPVNLPASADDWIIIQGLLILGKYGTDNETEISCTPAHFTPLMVTSETQQTTTEPTQWGESSPRLSRSVTGQGTEHSGKLICDVTLFEKNSQQRPCGKVCKNTRALSAHKINYHSGQRTCDATVLGEDGKEQSCGKLCKNTQLLSYHKKRDHTGQQICKAIVVGKHGQQRQCEKVCNNAASLANHKKNFHSGQKTCKTTVVSEDGQPRLCGIVFGTTQALFYHKSRDHTGQQICDVIMIGKDGQQLPCGIVCNNAKALSDHKSNFHTGQRTCDLTLIGEDGQQWPCGKVCKSNKELLYHKRRHHTGQKTCDLTVVGEHHQLEPCGKVCNNAQALLMHKSRFHKRQRTCQVTIVGEDSQPQPCGKLCKSIEALLDHIRRDHTGKQTCNVVLIPEDGQPRQCGKVCISAKALSNHKRIHRKRKPVGGNQDVDPSAPKGRANR